MLGAQRRNLGRAESLQTAVTERSDIAGFHRQKLLACQRADIGLRQARCLRRGKRNKLLRTQPPHLARGQGDQLADTQTRNLQRSQCTELRLVQCLQGTGRQNREIGGFHRHQLHGAECAHVCGRKPRNLSRAQSK